VEVPVDIDSDDERLGSPPAAASIGDSTLDRPRIRARDHHTS
jgi:hypothetical protein